MMTFEEALHRIDTVLQDPRHAIINWKDRTGGKVVGCLSCMPPFVPEEIIDAGGMLPVGIWGAEIPVRIADAKLQSFACSVARTSLEMALNGTLSVCEAFLIPSCCDAFQNVAEVWKLVVDRPCFTVTFPKRVEHRLAAAYLEREFHVLRAELGRFCDRPIREAALRASIGLFNEHRSCMRELDGMRARAPGFLSPRRMTEIVLAASFLGRQEHLRIVEALRASYPRAGMRTRGRLDKRPRVFLTGIMARPIALVDALEELGVDVVGDDLGLGSLYYSLEIPSGARPERDLAEGYLCYPPCSTLHRSEPARCAALVRRVQELGAQGVVILATKFCEPEFFDAPELQERLKMEGIPSLLVETELGGAARGSIRTRVEAFVEGLRTGRGDPAQG